MHYKLTIPLEYENQPYELYQLATIPRLIRGKSGWYFSELQDLDGLHALSLSNKAPIPLKPCLDINGLKLCEPNTISKGSVKTCLLDIFNHKNNSTACRLDTWGAYDDRCTSKSLTSGILISTAVPITVHSKSDDLFTDSSKKYNSTFFLSNGKVQLTTQCNGLLISTKKVEGTPLEIRVNDTHEISNFGILEHNDNFVNSLDDLKNVQKEMADQVQKVQNSTKAASGLLWNVLEWNKPHATPAQITLSALIYSFIFGIVVALGVYLYCYCSKPSVSVGNRPSGFARLLSETPL